MHEPLVTVIVPTRNRLAFLKEAVESILNQTYKNLEIIIQDNNCQDGTAEYVKDLCQKDQRVVYQRSDTDLTMLENWNAATEKMHGEYFLRFDDDNFLLNNFIEFAVTKMQKFSLDYLNCFSWHVNCSQGSAFYMFEPDNKTYLLSKNDLLLLESEAWLDSNFTLYRLDTIRKLCSQEKKKIYETNLPDRNLTYRLVMGIENFRAAVSAVPMGVTRLGHLFSYSICPAFSLQKIKNLQLSATDCHCCFAVERLNSLIDTLNSSENGKKLLEYHYKRWQSKASINILKYSEYLRCIDKKQLKFLEKLQLSFMYINLFLYVLRHILSKYYGTTILRGKFIQCFFQNKMPTKLDDYKIILTNIKNSQQLPSASAKRGSICSYLEQVQII